MRKDSVDKLIGKFCKIITCEPGEKRTRAVTGIVKEIDHDDGFIMIESHQGIGCLRLNTIVSIKPRRKLDGDT